MTVNLKKGVKVERPTMADFLTAIQKDEGEEIGSFGGRLAQSDRIPTGLFPLDLAMAGGFPRGKTSVIFGPESSGKTNIALRAIAMHQLLWPAETCAFFDVENSFDPLWAKRLGVQVKRLVVVQPRYGEQLVDMVESALLTDDCGLVVIDSVAAILGTAEGEASADRAAVGGNSILVGKLSRKSNNAMGDANKRNKFPSLFYINQVRSRVGVVYGNPEIMPGGNAPRFQANVILRVYGKNLMDEKVSTTMPVIKDTKFVMAKWKCPVLTEGGTFQMVMVPHGGLKVGQCNDYNTVSEYLKAYGQFEKDAKKGWSILQEHYDTIAPFKARLYQDAKFGAAVRAQIIEREAKTNELLQEKEYEATEDALEVAS